MNLILNKSSWLAVTVFLAANIATATMAMEGKKLKPDQNMAPPPDYEQVIKAEFDSLSARGTKEAMELFIERHPGHPMAEVARKRLEAFED